MVNVMLRCGLRTVEVARANVGDLRTLGGRSVLFVWGKGRAGADEFVVLDEAAMAPITAYLQARGRVAEDEPLFAGTGNRNHGGRLTTRTVSRVAKRTMEREGIVSAHVTAHSLRHTAVTLALLGGATVQEAQAMARHSDISTTQIYAHNLDRLAAAGERSVSAMLAG
jgi:integrase/recombinase XerC/integrase/recombinase XerD